MALHTEAAAWEESRGEDGSGALGFECGDALTEGVDLAHAGEFSLRFRLPNGGEDAQVVRLQLLLKSIKARIYAGETAFGFALERLKANLKFANVGSDDVLNQLLQCL